MKASGLIFFLNFLYIFTLTRERVGLLESLLRVEIMQIKKASSESTRKVPFQTKHCFNDNLQPCSRQKLQTYMLKLKIIIRMWVSLKESS